MNFLFKLFVVASFVATAASGETPLANTTRFWNCCKASCSWPNVANVSSTVQVCAKDGVEPVVDGMVSVCGGGGAVPGKSYMCNSQQPHAVNSSLAFGFAAGQLAGLGMEQTCCACYELGFPDTTLVGQKLVVQLTNTGVDLAENHFDLQIPGGGVGQMGKGCHDQWAASIDGWGKRYGGISADAECSQLPKQLQAGCHWRFGWFKGVHDPKATFQRVQCPKSLLDITKCKRADESSVTNAAYANL